jgi:tellurite methyltransferase
LALRAEVADLSQHQPAADSCDAAIAIGLLMPFDGRTARRLLARLRAAVRPGGVAIIDVLTQGTTWLEAFGRDPCWLWPAEELRRAFERWLSACASPRPGDRLAIASRCQEAAVRQ